MLDGQVVPLTVVLEVPKRVAFLFRMFNDIGAHVPRLERGRRRARLLIPEKIGSGNERPLGGAQIDYGACRIYRRIGRCAARGPDHRRSCGVIDTDVESFRRARRSNIPGYVSNDLGSLKAELLNVGLSAHRGDRIVRAVRKPQRTSGPAPHPALTDRSCRRGRFGITAAIRHQRRSDRGARYA